MDSGMNGLRSVCVCMCVQSYLYYVIQLAVNE